MVDGVEDMAFIAGIVMGSILLLSVSWVWVTRQVLGSGGIAMSFVGVTLVGLTVWSSIRIEASPDGILAEFERELEQLNSMVNEVDTRVAEVDSDLSQVVSANLSFNEDLERLASSVETNSREFISLTDQLKSSSVTADIPLDNVRDRIVMPELEADSIRLRRQTLEGLRRN